MMIILFNQDLRPYRCDVRAWIIVLIWGLMTGCQGKSAVVEESPTPSPVAIASPSPQDSRKSSLVQNDRKTLQRALDKAYGAASIAQSAQSGEDWGLVARQWEQAIALLQQIPAQSPHYPLAQEKVTQYQQNLTYAQTQESANASPMEPSPQIIAVKPKPIAKVQPKPQPVQPAQGAFQAQIKRREGGIPVIDVVFNGTETFEMIVDTGATGVVVTQTMAQSLDLPVIGSAKMDTASAKGITVPVGLVESIAVKGVVVRQLPVIIAGSQLDIGLLGHDFFGEYDLIIRQDVIEFQSR